MDRSKTLDKRVDDAPEDPRGGRVRALVLFPLVIAVVAWLAWRYGGAIAAALDDLPALAERVRALGWVGPAAVVAFQVIQVVIFLIPGEVVQIASGYLYGVGGGVMLSVAGIMIGSVVNFAVGRYLGRPFVAAVVGPRRLQKIDAIVGRQPTHVGYFLLFVIPGLPKDVLGYLGGAAGPRALTVTTFIVYSMVGRLPGIIGSAAIGHSAAAGYPRLAIALLAAAAVALIVGLLMRERIQQWLLARAGRDLRDGR